MITRLAQGTWPFNSAFKLYIHKNKKSNHLLFRVDIETQQYTDTYLNNKLKCLFTNDTSIINYRYFESLRVSTISYPLNTQEHTSPTDSP